MFRTLRAFIKRKLDPGPPTHLVLVEPADFRWAECYVLGPFPWKQALRVAKLEVRRHPGGQIEVVSRYGTIMQGDEVLRPADPPDGPGLTPVMATQWDFFQYRRHCRAANQHQGHLG